MEEFCALLLLSNGTALYLHLSCRAASSAGAAFWVIISQLAVIVHTHIHGSWQEVTMHFVNDIHRMVLLYPFSDIAIIFVCMVYLMGPPTTAFSHSLHSLPTTKLFSTHDLLVHWLFVSRDRLICTVYVVSLSLSTVANRAQCTAT